MEHKLITMKTIERVGLAKSAGSDRPKFKAFKKKADRKIDKTALKTNLLYAFAIISITAWIVSLRIFPFGDTFQFLLGGVVLSVNLMIFKHTKI